MELRNHCEPDWVYPHQDRIESESHSGHQRIRNWDRGVEAADGRIADPPPQETPRLELHAVSAIRALIVHLIVPYRLSAWKRWACFASRACGCGEWSERMRDMMLSVSMPPL